MPSRAASTSWTGTSSAKWNSSGNWTAGVPGSSVDAIIGDTNFTGLYQPVVPVNSSCKSLVIGTGDQACTLTIAKNLTCSSNVIIGAKGTITNNSGTFAFSGHWTNYGAYYPGSSPTLKLQGSTRQYLMAYTNLNLRHLTVDRSSTAVLATNITVLGNLSVLGTIDPDETTDWRLTVNGSSSVTGTLKVKGAAFTNNYVLAGSPVLSGTVEYAAASHSQIVSANVTYGALKLSGAGAKYLSENIVVSDLNVAAGTFDLNSFTLSRGTGKPGGSLTVAAGATMRIGGANSIPSNYKTHSFDAASTIEYYGSNQVISPETYGNLLLTSSAGNSSISVSGTSTTAATLSTRLAGGTGLQFAINAPLIINGAGGINIGTGTTFNCGSTSVTNKGNLTNNGAFFGGSGSYVVAGAGRLIAGSGTNQFNQLIITAAGALLQSNIDLLVGGNLQTVGAGTLTHLTGNGTLTMNGSSAQILGAGVTLNNLSISGSVTTPSSFTLNGNLAVPGRFSATSGTITLAGNNKTVTGPGTIAFNSLVVPGSISVSANFSVSGNISVPGSFIANTGNAFFNGSSTLSGSMSLFDATLNGTRLQLGGGSTLGVAGALFIQNGTFDTSNSVPNTVVYNGNGTQVLAPLAYHNLNCAGTGTKNATGPMLVNGDLTIQPGVVLNPGSYTHSYAGDFVNYGTFSASTDTEQFIGAANTSIVGSTTFNDLRINKDSSANIVFLGNNVTAAIVDVSNGQLDTGTNVLTITQNRAGTGTILGTITRFHSFSTGIPYAFESPHTTITFSAMGTVDSITMTTETGPVAGFPMNSAINRRYSIGLVSSGICTAALRLHYEDSELNGADEAIMQLWRLGASWKASGKSTNDVVGNWVEQLNVDDLNGDWTLSDDKDVVQWNGSFSSAWEAAENWTVIRGSPTLPPSSNEVVELGMVDAANQPTINSLVTVKSLYFGSVQPVTLSLLSGSLRTGGNIGGSWTNEAAHSINVGTHSLYVGGDLTLSDGISGHTINVSADSGSITVVGTLTQSGEATLELKGSSILSLNSSFKHVSGSFSPGTGSVVFYGSQAQTVAGLDYQNLVIANPGGIATLAVPATVNGDLMLTNSGTLAVNAPLSIIGSVKATPGTSLKFGSVCVSVGGDWDVRGVFTPGSSTNVFDGSGVQQIGSGVFNHLQIRKPSGVAWLTGEVVVNGVLDVSAGRLNFGTNKLTRSVYGGELLVASNSVVEIGTGSSFPANFGVYALAPQSTIVYSGIDPQNIAGIVYGNLLLSNGGTNPKILQDSTTVIGDLCIETNATLTASSNTLTLQGDFVNYGAFIPSGSLLFAGTAKSITHSTNTGFDTFTVTGSYSVSGGDIRLIGPAAIDGSLSMGTNTLFVGNDFALAGSLASSGAVTFLGTGPQVISCPASVFPLSAVVNYNGNVPPIFTGTNAIQFGSINISNSGGISPTQPWTVLRTVTIAPGATFSGGPWTHVFNGAFSNKGSVESSGILDFEPTAPQVIELSGTSFTSSGTVVFGGDQLLNFAGGPASFNVLCVSNTHPAGITPVSNWQIADSLRVSSGSLFNAGTGLTHTISGSILNQGIINGGTSTILCNGASAIGGSGTTVLNDLIITSTGSQTNLSDLTLTGSLTNNGSFDGNNCSITFNGNSSSFIGGTVAPSIDYLVISKTAGGLSLGIDVVGLTSVTVDNGTLDLGSFTLITNAQASGILNLAAGTVLKIAGAGSLPRFPSFAFSPFSTVHYCGAGTQTVAGANYGNLTSSGSGPRILDSSAAIGIAGVFSPGANSYVNSGSTIVFNGSDAQTIPSFNYHNLSSTGIGTRILAANGSIGVAGSFSPGSNTYTTDASTISFNGTSQAVPVFNYHHLTLSGGTKTASGNLTIAGNLNLSSTILADAGFNVVVNGNIANSGAHIGNGRVVLRDGSATHQLTGNGAFARLELDDTNGATLISTNLTVTNSLILTSGSIVTSTNKVIIPSSASVSRTTGQVIGQLQKFVTNQLGSIAFFEVGTTNGYNPVRLSFANVTTSGVVTVSALAQDHPSINTSILVPGKSANVYWTIAPNSALGFTTCDASFNFTATDIDPGAAPASFVVGQYGAATWTYPRYSLRTPTNITVNLTKFGDFQAAEFPRTNNISWAANGPSLDWTTNESAYGWVNGAMSDNFKNGDNVFFFSSTSNRTIHITTAVLPASVTVDATNDYCFDGTGSISGTTGITKTNTGKLIIRNTNNFTGTTLVCKGTLLLENGSIGHSQVIVTNSGTLAGFGRVGPMTVLSGGLLSPGASPGTLFASNTTWAGGATYRWELNNANAAAGANPGWDLLVVDGYLDIQAVATNRFTIDICSLSGEFSGWVSNFNFRTCYSWPIATASAGVRNFDSSRFTIKTNQFQNFTGGGTFSIITNNNSLVLVFTPRVCQLGDISCTWIATNVSGIQGARLSFVDHFGIGKVVGFNMTNCNLTGTAFGPGLSAGGVNLGSIGTSIVNLPAGTTNLIMVALRSNRNSPGVVNARAWDACDGFAKSFDPVLTTLAVKQGSGVQQRFTGLMQVERLVRIHNGSPGLRSLYIIVNGWIYAVNAIEPNEEISVDVGDAMIPGNGNAIVLIGAGEPGAAAEIVIAEFPPAMAQVGIEKAVLAGAVPPGNNVADDLANYVPELNIERKDSGAILSWPASPIPFEVQGASILAASLNWAPVPGTPTLSNGLWTLRVDKSSDMTVFRLRGKPQ